MRVCQPVINMVDHDGVMSGGWGGLDWDNYTIANNIPGRRLGLYEVLKCESGFVGQARLR